MCRDRVSLFFVKVVLCRQTSYHFNIMNRQILRGFAAAVSLFALSASASAEVNHSQTSTAAVRPDAFRLFETQFDAKLATPVSFNSAMSARRSFVMQYQSKIQEIVGGGTCVSACFGWGITITSDVSNIYYIRVDIQCFFPEGPFYYGYQGLFNAAYAYKECNFPVDDPGYTDFEIYSTHGWSIDGVGYDQAYTHDEAHI